MTDTTWTPPAGKDIFGHPRGLSYLVFAEAWERFSYYGMLALLANYLREYLLVPGHVEQVAAYMPFHAFLQGVYGELATPIATATAITGLYSAGVYFTPMIGGFIADRWLGRTATVTIGALLMVAGHFLMAFEAAFVFAILCLFVGVGLFKGNIASQVGELYGPDDLRRSSAFQAFLLGVQIAVIVAPLVVGSLRTTSWHWGFAAAGVGMALGLVVYLSGRKYLPPERPRGAARKAAPPQPKLTRRDWMTMLVLVAMLPVLAMTAIGNQEIFNAYPIWGKDHYALIVPELPNWLPFAASISGKEMPVEFLLSLDAFISTFTVGGALIFWSVWAKYGKEPDEIIKLAIGALIAAGAPLLLALGSANEAATGQKVSLLWGIGFHVINDIGFAMIFPVGLALFSRAAPRQVGGMFIGVYYLHLFICNLATGKIAGLIEKMDGFSFWAMHAAIVAAGAVALVVFAIFFRSLLAPTAADLAQDTQTQQQPAPA